VKRKIGLVVLWLTPAAAGAICLAAVVSSFTHRATLETYPLPIVAAIVISIILAAPTVRRNLLAAALAASCGGLALADWGYSLDAAATAKLFEQRFPDARPAVCVRDPRDGSFVGTLFRCGKRGESIRSYTGVVVSDDGIVEIQP
jgi:hypothetical protein